ncbi:MAG: fibrobacter succinogenes major paralogous domain-containing protein [Rikenella sp.]|nr:fibrobacter succinogenes major paralogous domain-containing protein [Rikenella sp.]
MLRALFDPFSAIRNPGSLYVNNQDDNWTAPQNDELWQDGVKTLFDPCPSGWRVPLSGEMRIGRNPWDPFSIDNGTWNVSGMSWSTMTSTLRTWYPAAGYREARSGSFRNGGANANYWSSSVRDACRASNFHFTERYVYPNNPTAGQRSFGFSTRCVRE